MRRTRGTALAAMAAFGALAGVTHAVVTTPASAAVKRNVVVIMADDQDIRSMQFMPKTKRLIGRTGTTYTNSLASFPLCCPSRATFFTGQYAHNHGVQWNFHPTGGYYRLKQAETLPVWLQRAGYRTIHVGKFLNETGTKDPTEIPKGWTDWHGGVDPYTYAYYGYRINHNGKVKQYGTRPQDYSTDVYAGLAEDALRDAKKRGTPFFLSVAPNAPHTVSVKSNAEIEGTPAEPAPRHAGRFASAELPRYPNFNEPDVSDKPPVVSVLLPPLNDREIASLTAHYRGRMGAVLALDDLVERVMTTLKRTGLDRTTDVIYTSDNGWMLGEHRFRDPFSESGEVSGVKFFPFEQSAEVPLLATGPSFPRGRTVSAAVVNADLAPTVLEITGAKPKLPQDGRSLLAAARRPAAAADRGVLLEGFDNPRGAPAYKAIRTSRYLYYLQADGDEQLFDYRVDPWELDSKHDDAAWAEVKAVLRKALVKLRDCRGSACQVRVGELPEPGA